MHRFKRFGVVFLTALSLILAVLPATQTADAASRVLISRKAPDTSLLAAAPDRTEEPGQNEALIAQIRETYAAAKKKARVKSFKGKCGAYVNHQLVLLGINAKYIGANGNREYDIYCKLKESTGGYAVHAFGAKKYTLKSALEAIEKLDPNARNILIGFQKGTSKASKKYGHTLLIHGIENGMVYFSDSYAQKVDGVRYKEGEPIICSIATFAKLYQRYKLDGVIWFS